MPPPPIVKKRIDIHDVARQANCSIATISMVLNGTGRVGDARREKILALIKKMGYQPNIAGRNLRLQRSDTIGLMFNRAPFEVFSNIFMVSVMEGIESTLDSNGMNLLLGSGRSDLSRGILPKFMRQGAIDGMILLGHFSNDDLELLLTAPIPILLLDSSHPQLSLESLTSDGYGGVAQAVEHCVALGHERIAMLAYRLPDYNTSTRIAGFRATTRRLGLKEEDCPVIDHFLHDELPPILDELFSRPSAPTAILCVNDTLAVYVSTYLSGSGYRIPQDISLIGFDDDSIAAANNPPLTTVRIDTKEMGSKGAEMLFERLKEPKQPVRKIVLPVHLVERDSTAPPASTGAKKLRRVRSRR